MPRLPSLWWFGYFLKSYNVLGKFKKILQSSFGFSTGEALSVYFTTSVRSMMSASDA